MAAIIPGREDDRGGRDDTRLARRRLGAAGRSLDVVAVGAWSKVEVEGGGPQQLGSVRILEKKPYRLRELVTDWVPGERTAYDLLEGMRVGIGP